MTPVPSPFARLRVVVFVSALAALPATPKPQPAASPSWTQVDALIEDQKLQEASGLVDRLLESAKRRQDEADWTKALVRGVQLRIGLGSYETAIRFLKEQPWPSGLLFRTTLDLFYGQALVQYERAYSWEIGQRERVASAGDLDLKLWTREQVFDEAQKAYARAWDRRAPLGELPVGALSEYVEPNDYPKDVRGTLRDAVSYLTVDLLADSTLWTPAESNDAYLLDLPALLSAGGSRAADAPESRHAHPLEKLVAVLADLEAWHAGRGERAAELEARLERDRRLHAAFSRPEDRARVRKDLEARLPPYRSVSWWAMGMARLAELREADEAPDNLVRAREAAIEGFRAYPDSPGGRLANRIVAGIEAPSYETTAMWSDGPGRPSIRVSHKNLSALYFRAYRVDLDESVMNNGRLAPSPADVRSLLRDRPDAEWETPLPATADFKPHVTDVTPPMGALGAWTIVASVRKDFAESANVVSGAVLVLSDLVVVTHSEPGALDVRVVSGESGTPVEGVDVSLWRVDWKQNPRRMERTATDVRGHARVSWTPEMAEGRVYLAARKGDDAVLDKRFLDFGARPEEEKSTRSLIYTDRSIYRPGQRILWKVVAYGGAPASGRLVAAPNAAITVSLRDVNGESVGSREVVTNSFGSAAGEFAIPAGRALGNWSIESSASGRSTVRVEEYKRPTFEVAWSDPAIPLRLNRTATLTGSVRYYFGLPVTQGAVRWTVKREPLYPPWWRGWGASPAGETTIGEGTASVNPDGTFAVSFTPSADERLAGPEKDVSYLFEVRADVTDEGGETRFATRIVRLGFVSLEAQIRFDTGFVPAGSRASATVVLQDLNGVPRSGSGTWRLLPLEPPASVRMPADVPADTPAATASGATPGDRRRPRWETGGSFADAWRSWKDGRERAAGAVVHDAQGRGSIELPPLPPGVYRLRYETPDPVGGSAEASAEFLVAGKTAPVFVPEVLLAERPSVPVGSTARLVVASGLAEQTLFLDVVRANVVVSSRQLSSSASGVIEIPVVEADRGGFSVELSLVRDHQFLTQRVSVSVPWDDKKLDVAFETFRDRLRPGAREVWRVRVTAPPGTPAEARAAEVLASMYDRSLDAFVPYDPFDPLRLYPDRTYDAGFWSSLGQARWDYVFGRDLARIPPGPRLATDRLKFFDGRVMGGPGIRMMKSTATLADAAAPVEGGVPGGVLGGVVARSASAAEVTVAGITPPSGPQEPAPPPTLRSDFSETAFWKPQLLTDADGSAVIEFQVPDSVTSWNVWVHAITKDFRAGSTHREARSVKDLMVRPYVPRFLREGDRGDLKVVVNNASERPMTGTVALDILDAETNRSVLAEFGLTPDAASHAFAAAAGGSADATFTLAAPKRVGAYAIKATAVSGDLSDGELRPVPVLPGRMQLSQSRFAALRGGDTRTLAFGDMAKTDDPSRVNEQLAVTVDAQLFYSVLNALPFLVNYPYECVEQTLNRFVSTGIVSSLFRQYPTVERMARDLAKRDTPLEAWTAPDPTRRMALEETPWLEAAKGGKDAGAGLVKVLDPSAATAERETSLAKLRQAQTASGAFPWWSGGPPSPYMTLYVMYGFAKAAEFGVDVPKDVVARGWAYLAAQFREEYEKRMAADRCSPEWLTFLAYVATCYPDPSWMGGALTPAERTAILAFSFRHWREQSPYLKGMLALALERSGRADDARRVWASVMDSSKTDADLGTYWAPEDRAWLWYEDTIETQAFALHALMEIAPSDPRRHGLVQWLFLHKKLNQWKSTRATAEVLYALVAYLKKEGALAARESVTVALSGQKTVFDFEPDRYTGSRDQIVVPGERIDPRRDADVVVSKTGTGLAFVSATWSFSTDRLPAEDRGDLFAVSRRYYRREPASLGVELRPLAEGAALSPGDEVEVQLSIRARHAAEYVHLRDPRAAGLEPGVATSGWRWDLGLVRYEEIRDSGTNFFFEWLPAGEYTLKYRVRASMAGIFRVGPATLQSMYAPEFSAYSAGSMVMVR